MIEHAALLAKRYIGYSWHWVTSSSD